MSCFIHQFDWLVLLVVAAALDSQGKCQAAAPEPSAPASHASPAGPAQTEAALPDDTVTLQRLVDRGGTVRLSGTLRITRPIVAELNKTGFLSICGDGTARIVMAGAGPALRLVGTHQGTASPPSVQPSVWDKQRMPAVDGLEIVGAHPEACGIEAVGTMKLTITRVLVREALHGIRLTQRNRNVIVADCHLYHNRGVGLYLDNVDLHQINVSACHISYNSEGGVVVRAGCLRNLQISGCDIEANRFNVLLDSTGSACGSAEVEITGCTLQHSGGDDSANVRFLGGDLQDNRAWGHLTIANNVLSDVHVNVDLQKARGVNILGNTFGVAYQHNLKMVDCTNVVVGPNVFERNPKYRDENKADNALLIRNCEGVTLTGLHIQGVRRAEAGLVFEDCSRVNLTSSTILDCDRAGLLLRNVRLSRVSDCLIRNDAVPSGEPWTSIQCTGGSGNMLVNNLLSRSASVEPGSAQASGNVVAE